MSAGPNAPVRRRSDLGIRAAVVLAITIILVGASTTTGYALWNAATSKTASVSAGTIDLTTAGQTALTVNYKAASGPIAAVTTDTAPITISDTGTTPLTYTLAVTGMNSTFGGQVALRLWRATTAAPCTAAATVPAAATTGTLAAPPAMPAAAATAAAGESFDLCVRTTYTGTPANSIGATGTATVAVTGRVGTNWSTTDSGTFTQGVTYSWFQIRQESTGKCLDAEDNLSANGTDVIIFPCKELTADNNQAWRLVAVGNSTTQFKVLMPLGVFPAWQTSSNNNGAIVELYAQTTTGTAAARQTFTFTAHGTPGDYQIRASSGLCISLPSTVDVTTLEVDTCTNSTNTTNAAYIRQHFNLVTIP